MAHKFVSLTVPGRPRAKNRARWNTHSSHIYTPQRAQDAEEIMQGAMQEACSVPLTGALELGVKFCFRRPTNWSKARRDAVDNGEEPLYEGKPDLDNLMKLLKDSGNGILWLDDAQICKYRDVVKVYSAESQTVINVMTVI